MRLVHRLAIVAVVVGLGMAAAAKAEAASFTVNFCPGAASCPNGISEARLTFDDVLSGTDPNDYTVTIKIVGNATSPAFVDSVSFSIDGAQTPGSYEALPLLSVHPAGTWQTFFDGINQGNPCGVAPF